MGMVLHQLIAPAGMLCLAFVSCTANMNREKNNINNNHPALDTINVKADTIKNTPIPYPDSIIRSHDTLA